MVVAVVVTEIVLVAVIVMGTLLESFVFGIAVVGVPIDLVVVPY